MWVLCAVWALIPLPCTIALSLVSLSNLRPTHHLDYGAFRDPPPRDLPSALCIGHAFAATRLELSGSRRTTQVTRKHCDTATLHSGPERNSRWCHTLHC